MWYNVGMSKKLLVSILLIALLVSLFFNFKNKEEKQVLQDTKKQVSFEQKQKCAVYRKEFETKFEKNNNSDFHIGYEYLDKIFYSPKLQSCLVEYHTFFGIKAKERSETSYLDDALTGESILQTTIISNGVYDPKSELMFNNLLKEYE